MEVTTIPMKADMLNRLGGENQFYFILLELSDQIKTDKRLKRFYSHYDVKDMAKFLKEWILLTFAKPTDEMNEEDIENRIRRLYFPFLKMGMHKRHYSKLVKYCVDALRSSWVEELVIIRAVKYLQSFQHLFKERDELSNSSRHSYDTNDEMEEEKKEEPGRKKLPRMKRLARSMSYKGFRSSDGLKAPTGFRRIISKSFNGRIARHATGVESTAR